MRLTRVLLLAVLATGVSDARAEAVSRRTTEIPKAAPLGAVVDAPGGRGDMELVRFEGRAVSILLAAGPEEPVRVEDWPVSPGQRATVTLRRFDVYAPDARIVVLENGVEREIPRVGLAFFRGEVEAGPDAGSRFATWIDPESGNVGGFAMTNRGTVALLPPEPGREESRVTLAEDLRPAGEVPAWTCGVPDGGSDPAWAAAQWRGRASSAQPTARSGGVSALGTLTKTAVIAFDTDAEYLGLRFSNNVGQAAIYIAQLVAGMSVIYERDIASVQDNGVRILQGYTILRVGETSDPYTDTISSADSTKLNEFGAYWDAHYPTGVVRRALAALLSGKQGSPNSASGIGWLGSLCASSTTGYSVNQLFTGAWGVWTDLGILAHEVGHNFGAFHTHSCYYGTPPIDTCLAAEGDCAVATGCPGSQTFNGVTTNGTLMSYCHIIGCSPRVLVFHPRSVTDNPTDPYGVDSVLQEVTAASCMSSLAGGVVPPAPTVTNVAPATGPLAGGTSVVITGTNFVNGATVAFVELPSNNVFGTPSSRAATAVTVNGATQLTATTPSASSAGAVDVVVMNPDRQTATRSSGFTYTSGPIVLALSAVLPLTGPAAGGTPVTLTGSGFLAGATVTIGAATATSVIVASSTTITAVAPARPIGPANVVVTNPGGATATIPGGFIYTATGAATRLYTMTPCRLVDTRNPAGPFGGPALAAGATRSYAVSAGSCSIPADAAGVSLNVTVADATAPGTLTFFPGTGTPPGTNTIAFGPGKNRANNATLGVVGGGLSVRNYQATGTVHLIVDVNGYYR